jgi:hypothetical protein
MIAAGLLVVSVPAQGQAQPIWIVQAGCEIESTEGERVPQESVRTDIDAAALVLLGGPMDGEFDTSLVGGLAAVRVFLPGGLLLGGAVGPGYGKQGDLDDPQWTGFALFASALAGYHWTDVARQLIYSAREPDCSQATVDTSHVWRSHMLAVEPVFLLLDEPGGGAHVLYEYGSLDYEGWWDLRWNVGVKVGYVHGLGGGGGVLAGFEFFHINVQGSFAIYGQEQGVVGLLSLSGGLSLHPGAALPDEPGDLEEMGQAQLPQTEGS